MNVARLKLAAEKLEELQGRLNTETKTFEINGVTMGFNLRVWYSNPNHYFDHEIAGDCGTACCGAGYLGMLPEFNTDGFETDKREGSVVYQGTFSWIAIRKYFGLGDEASDFIFDGDAYDWADFPNGPTPGDVAARIRQVLSARLLVADPI